MKQADFVEVMNGLLARGEPFAVATVVRIEGSTLGKLGFKTIISKEGEVLCGSLGGPCPESAIAEKAKETLSSGTPRTVEVFLENVEDAVGRMVTVQDKDEVHLETNCGGKMEVFIEPYVPQQRILLVGQGGRSDVEDSLVRFGKILDFEVIVVDHSPVLTEEPDQLIDDLDFDIAGFKFFESDSVVVLTHSERDVDVLRALSGFKLRYVGLLGSRQRVKENLDALRSRGAEEKFVSSIRAPVGADIGARTPSEIALSIMAEVVATKYGRKLLRKDAATAEGLVPTSGAG